MESPALATQSAGSTRPPVPPAPLDVSVARRLRVVASRLRRYVFLEGAAWVIGFLTLAAFVQFVLDYGTRGLRWSIRAALLSAVIAGGLWVLWRRLIQPLRARIDAAEVANLVERRFPGLSSALISAVRFARGELGPAESNSPALAAAVINRASAAVGDINFGAILDPRRARWAGVALLATAAVVFSVAAMQPSLASLWFERNVLLRDVPWPKRTHLLVEAASGGELIGARGDDFIVEATADGVQPSEVEFYYATESGLEGRETMVTVGSAGAYRYRYTFKNAREDFSFYLRGGDDRTDPFRVRLVDRPAVSAARLRVVPPAYTRLDPVTLAPDERAAQMLTGSEVTLRIETNKPVADAVLVTGPDRVAEAAPAGSASPGDATAYEVTFSPGKTANYHFALRDELGFENREPARFAVRVIADEAPRVRLRIPGAGEMITPQAILPIELEYADTYGLATAELIYRRTHEDMRVDDIAVTGFEPHAKSFKTSLFWPVSASGGVPGDRLTLVARASDFDDVSGPNVSESPEALFRVVTPDELFAELARREQEFRMDFERLIDAQEGLRGRLLTLMGPAAPAAASAEFGAAIADAERRQRSVAQSVNVVGQQVEQILAELRVNQLSNPDIEERLGERIAQPLSLLAAREFPTAADAIRRWGRDTSPDVAARVDEQQVAILSQMREILASMIQWEGYQEAVTMLRDILRMQSELKAETQEAITRKAGDVFER